MNIESIEIPDDFEFRDVFNRNFTIKNHEVNMITKIPNPSFIVLHYGDDARAVWIAGPHDSSPTKNYNRGEDGFIRLLQIAFIAQVLE